MSWVELGFQTVSNLGVIIGLFFLAAQLRQNNKIADSNARMDRRAIGMGAFDVILNNPEMLETMAKEARGGALNELEVFRMNVLWMRVWAGLEFTYKDGRLDTTALGIQKRNARIYPSYRSAWTERRQVFSSDYVKWIDDEVLSAATK